MQPILNLGELKLANTLDFKITKESLIPSNPWSQGGKSLTINYFSKVAEVNDKGELEGSETTNSDASASSEEDEVVIQRNA